MRCIYMRKREMANYLLFASGVYMYLLTPMPIQMHRIIREKNTTIVFNFLQMIVNIILG